MNFPASFNLADLDNSNGFVINGIDSEDSGISVNNAGDVNGDGFDDILIAAPFADPNGEISAGETYVIFGSNQDFSNQFNLSSLDGNNGFVINGIGERNFLGFPVSSAGDINGDGFNDILIGAYFQDLYNNNVNPNVPEIYVVFGSDQDFGASFDLSSLDGSNGFVLNGVIRSFRPAVSSAGDINGDGFDDLLIGVVTGGPIGIPGAGETFVVFGRAQDFEASIDLRSLDGSNGFIINGIDVTDFSGDSVSSAGDFNGDGFDDILISASFADKFNSSDDDTGESYIVFGKDQGFGASLDLASLNGSNGFVINSVDSLDSSAIQVSSGGDINGDGFDDILISNPGTAGEIAYVILGSNQSFGASFDPSSLNGNNGFVVEGVTGSSFNRVSTAGDVNGDGLDDILIGVSGADPNGNINAGETYVIYGSEQGFEASFHLCSLNGSNGFVINSIATGDGSGAQVSSAGDVNGDGFDDILIGAPEADSNGNGNAGETYVVFGRASDSTPTTPTTTAIEWNTDTGLVSSFRINTDTATASSNALGRAIYDRNWQLEATGDFNGDSRADVILRHGLSGQILTWHMAPTGHCIESEALIGRDVEDPNWSIVGTGDFNADGKTDIIWQNQAADQILAWYMDGQGGIEREALIGRDLGDSNWTIEAMADFNGDGQSDMILRNSESGQNLLWEMEGSSILAESLIGRDVPDSDWHIEGASDFDNNGTTDLFLRHRGVGQGLLWSMADSVNIASEQLITNVPTGASQLLV